MNKHDKNMSDLKPKEYDVSFALIVIYAVILLLAFWLGICFADYFLNPL